MAEDQDVTPADSSSAEATAANADAAAVTGDTQVGDRPVQNIAAEFNRKLGKLTERFEQARAEDQKRTDAILQYLASQTQAQTRQSVPPQGQGELSDEQLWTLAQSGDRLAFEEYQRRIADRNYQQRSQADRIQQTVTKQLNDLVTLHPALRDGSHPLTQRAHQEYSRMVQSGAPQGNATLLEAAKTALSYNPDLVSENWNQNATMRENTRQTANQRAQTGVTGAQHRRDVAPSAQNQKPKVSPQSLELAKRMGVKDPAGAKERMRKRLEEGRSGFGAVSAYIPEEDI